MTDGCGESTGQGKPARGESLPRLLFLCQTLPFPPDGGVQIRSFNILRLLSRSFDITALCFFRQATRSTAEAVADGLAGLSEYAHVEAFPIHQEQSRTRLIQDHARSVLLGTVYTRFAYGSADFRARLQEAVRNNRYALVHMDSLDLSVYLPDLMSIPVICTHHNVESNLLRRRSRTEASLLRSGYFRLQARLMEREERKWCPQVALNVTVSQGDAETLSAIAPGSRIRVVPNGVDTGAIRPLGGANRGIVFVGGYNWFPNRDAMEYFAADILPLIRRVERDLPVTWVGRVPEPLREKYESEHGIRLTGYVESIEPFVRDAACYIVPLRVGGGTRLKILDAWAMGKAIVSTSIGCEGLDARDGENILIRDTPQDFARAVQTVLRDSGLRRRIGAGGRRTAERVYDWNVIGKSMLPDYTAIAREGRSPHR